MNGRWQTGRKLFLVVAAVAGLALCAAFSFAQDEATSASAAPAVAVPSTVPRLIKFSGVVSPLIAGGEQNDSASKTAPPTTLRITFSLYELQEGGSPLLERDAKR